MMGSEMSIFDGINKFNLNGRKLRLIELFAGYGSQALALKYLGIPFESYFISEWAVKSIQAYKDMHHPDDNRHYDDILSDADVRKRLYGKISKNYNDPLEDSDIDRMPIAECRAIYNNMVACHNQGSVVGIHGKDVPITRKDKYAYLMFYSFPCQDLSSAGLGKGMERGSNTRSGMLWQVERLLLEWNELGSMPDVLIMENVPEVVGTKNLNAFSDWLASLDKLGYKSYKQILNATDYGIPQNRRRCFMVSILGDYFYEFPERIPLKYRLKDVCHPVGNVEEGYYLTDEQTANFVRSQPVNAEREREKAVIRSEAVDEAQLTGICGISLSKDGAKPVEMAHTCCAHNSKDGWNQNQAFAAIMESIPDEPRFIDTYNHKDIGEGKCGKITTNSAIGQCGVFAVVEPIKDGDGARIGQSLQFGGGTTLDGVSPALAVCHFAGVVEKTDVVGRVLTPEGKEHQNQEVYGGGGIMATIKATSYKDPPKTIEYGIEKK